MEVHEFAHPNIHPPLCEDTHDLTNGEAYKQFVMDWQLHQINSHILKQLEMEEKKRRKADAEERMENGSEDSDDSHSSVSSVHTEDLSQWSPSEEEEREETEEDRERREEYERARFGGQTREERKQWLKQKRKDRKKKEKQERKDRKKRLEDKKGSKQTWAEKQAMEKEKKKAEAEWRALGFIYHPRLLEKFKQDFERKPMEWEEFIKTRQDVEFQVLTVEEFEYTDSRDGKQSSGVGVYGMIDSQTRIYIQHRGFKNYGFMGVPQHWTPEDMQGFRDHVLWGSQAFLDFAYHEWMSCSGSSINCHKFLHKKRRDGEDIQKFFYRAFRCLKPEDGAIVDVELSAYRHLGAEGPAFPKYRASCIRVRKSSYLRDIRDFMTDPFVKGCAQKFLGLDSVDMMHQNPHMFKLYEFNHKIEHRFMVDLNVCAKMWVRAPLQSVTWVPEGHTAKETTCAYEVLMPQASKLQVLETKSEQVLMRWADIDMETFSQTGRFPNANNVGDYLYLINFNYRETAAPKGWKISLYMSDCLSDIYDMENKRIRFVVRNFDWKQWFEIMQGIIQVLDVDVLEGYNTSGFDFPYGYNYATTQQLIHRTPAFPLGYQYGPLPGTMAFPSFGMFSRRRGYFCPAKTVLRKSAQMGAQKNTRVFIPGRINIDLLLEMRSIVKLPSYTLDSAAHIKGINMAKMDLSPQKQFEYYRSNDPVKQELIDEYCAKDCEIPKKITEFFNPVEKYCQNSRCNWLNVEDQIWNGQQIRVCQNMILEQRNVRWYDVPFLMPYRPQAREAMEEERSVWFEDESEESSGAVFDFKQDMYCWDTRYDCELEMMSGVNGRFGKFPPVQRLIQEALHRRQLLEDYQKSLQTRLYFGYPGKTEDRLQEQVQSHNDFKDDELKDEKRLEQGEDEEENYQRLLELQRDADGEEEKASPKHFKLSQVANSLLARARWLSEGVKLIRVEDQYKARSLLKKEGFVQVKPKRFEELKKKFIPGATVLRPKKGFKKKPVITCDFNSLYPSIMLSCNMSDETKITKDHIAEFELEPEKDYYTVVTKRHEQFYRLTNGKLCSDCEKDPSNVVVCPCETAIEGEVIRKKNLAEGKDYYTHVLRHEEVYFLKQICSECMNCKDCEDERDHSPGAFCGKHKTCLQCPKIRFRAVLCGVIQRLLNLRAVNKKLMTKAKEKSDALYSQYLASVGFPLDTELDAIPHHDHGPESQELWEQYEYWKGQEEIFDGRQAGTKQTSNSVYGYKGAHKGICPDFQIAQAVTGEGRRMIYLIKSEIPFTATKWKDFWKECTAELAAKDKESKTHHLVCLDDDAENGEVELQINFPDLKKNTDTLEGTHLTFRVTRQQIRNSFLQSDTIYGDTDSIMCMLGMPPHMWNNNTPDRENIILAYQCALGEIACKYLTSLCRPPNKLGFEKVMWPYFLCSRKRYIYTKFINGAHSKAGKKVIQGLSVKRADTFKLLQDIFDLCLKEILRLKRTDEEHELGKHKLINIVRQKVQDLYDHTVSYDDITLSRSMRDHYKSDSLAHVQAAKKRKLRNESDEVHSGDRSAFVLCDGAWQRHANRKGKYEKPTDSLKKNVLAEDVGYAKASGIPYLPQPYLDLMYHPLTELLSWYYYAGQIEEEEVEDEIGEGRDHSSVEALERQRREEEGERKRRGSPFAIAQSQSESGKRRRVYTYEEAVERTGNLLFEPNVIQQRVRDVVVHDPDRNGVMVVKKEAVFIEIKKRKVCSSLSKEYEDLHDAVKKDELKRTKFNTQENLLSHFRPLTKQQNEETKHNSN